MLWYLHLCSDAGIAVIAYSDDPVAVGEIEPSGKGRFLSATLRPTIKIAAGGDVEKAEQIHHQIHDYCFIARSINFPVSYEPAITVES